MSCSPASRILALGVLACVSCVAPSPQLYEGPPRERSEIAVLIRPVVGDLRVLRIDESRAGGYEWHLAPGRHRVWVELVQFGNAMNVEFKAWSYCSLDFEAEAGGSYRILSENDQEAFGSSRRRPAAMSAPASTADLTSFPRAARAGPRVPR
jgi:hypothetical protein